MIYEAQESDLPFIMEVAAYSYGWSNTPLGNQWVKERIKDSNSVVIRGDHSFGIGFLFRSFYWKKPRGHILHVASIPKGLSREPLRIMQRIIDWAKNRDAFEVTFGSEIGTDYAPFAKLLGASPQAPSYVIRFERGQYA